MLSRVTTGN